MRSVLCLEFGDPALLREMDVPHRKPQMGEVLVKVSATGIGHVDGLMIQGRYQLKHSPPFCPGNEFSGVIVDNGTSSYFKIGDRVFGCAPAALSDYLIAHESDILRTPSHIDDDTAASIYINYLTSIYALKNCAAIQNGEVLLVMGASGGVGSAAMQIGRALGAEVIAAASSNDKLQFARSLTPDATINYSLPNWRKELAHLTSDKGLSVVFDPVGGDKAEEAFRSLSPGGRYLIIGFASGSIPSIKFNLPLLKRSSLIGVDWGGYMRDNAVSNEKMGNYLLQLLASSDFIPPQPRIFKASHYVSAFEHVISGSISGKIVLSRNVT